MDPPEANPHSPRIGSWARAGDLVGVVAGVEGDTIALYDPGNRQLTRVDRQEMAPVEAAALTVSLEVDLPVPHGLPEDALKRWLASLGDEVVRERARAALVEAGIDEGVALPQARLQVRAASSGGALCLCGARTPAPDGASLACVRCGREAVAPPARSDAGDVLGLARESPPT